MHERLVHIFATACSARLSFLSRVCVIGGETLTCCYMQGVRHSKPDEVTKEIKSQLKEQVHSSDSSLQETIVAAGKQKLAKKPEDKQSALTGIFILLHTFSWLYARLNADSAAVLE